MHKLQVVFVYAKGNFLLEFSLKCFSFNASSLVSLSITYKRCLEFNSKLYTLIYACMYDHVYDGTCRQNVNNRSRMDKQNNIRICKPFNIN